MALLDTVTFLSRPDFFKTTKAVIIFVVEAGASFTCGFFEYMTFLFFPFISTAELAVIRMTSFAKRLALKLKYIANMSMRILRDI